ncbi:MAG: MFS transporter, partial [Elusimicrobiota bacterium]
MSDRWKVALSFCFIFSFASIDSSIAPMVSELSRHFGSPLDRTLWLLSACTAGIVAGILLGPSLTSSFDCRKLFCGAVLGLALSHLLFVSAPGFGAALVWRAVFGLSCGLAASLLWWLTFHGVGREWYHAMVVVLMSARPLATALGVPGAGLAADAFGWKASFLGLGLLMTASGLGLCLTLGADRSPKKAFSPGRVLGEYREALALPHAAAFYAGMTINRMCYFGFYSLTGIWFLRHYGLGLAAISGCLLVIGAAEAAVNFSVPAMLRRWGHDRPFTLSLAASALLLP